MAVLNAGVVFGNYVLVLIAGLGCGAEGDTTSDDPFVCDLGFPLAFAFLGLPSVVALAGAVASLVRRRFDEAVVALLTAPFVAVLVWAFAWGL